MKQVTRIPQYFKDWVWQTQLIQYPRSYHFSKIDIERLLWLSFRKGKKAGQQDINGEMP